MQEQRTQASEIGKVTRCSAADCAYNDSLRCVAPHVDVGRHSDREGRHADCETYTLNQHLAEQVR